jgi:hypothetical protein
VSLDRKSDSEPTSGHQFFCLKHDFASSKYFFSFSRSSLRTEQHIKWITLYYTCSWTLTKIKFSVEKSDSGRTEDIGTRYGNQFLKHEWQLNEEQKKRFS